MNDILETLSNRDNDPKWVKANIHAIAKTIRARLAGSHLLVDTVSYNPITRRLWVGLTDCDLNKHRPGSAVAKITAWRAIRPGQELGEQIRMLVDEVKCHQESGVVRG